MLDIGKDQGLDPKCYFTSCRLPQQVDEKQLPTKRKPFAALASRAFNHHITLLLPDGGHAQTLEQRLKAVTRGTHYAKVHMKPQEVLQGDFFNKYIKSGNILLLSEGRRGVDNILSLHEGILRLELDKTAYERAGLQGKPIASPGRKHVKQRYLIEVNLRLPSMVRGRPQFNRLVYAFEKVLNKTLTWLFYDLESPDLSSSDLPSRNVLEEQDTAGPAATDEQPQPETSHSDPISAHAPFIRSIEFQRSALPDTKTPRGFAPIEGPEDEIEATEYLEWINLAMMGCPRLQAGDTIDPFLSSYQVPQVTGPSAQQQDNGIAEYDVQDLVVFELGAFVPSSVVIKILVMALKSLHKTWFAMRLQSFDGTASCTLLVENGTCMIWECE